MRNENLSRSPPMNNFLAEKLKKKMSEWSISLECLGLVAAAAAAAAAR